MKRIQPRAWAALFVIAALFALVVAKARGGASTSATAMRPAAVAMSDGGAIALPTVRETTNTLTRFTVRMPSATPVPVTTGQNIRMFTYAWNAHMGLSFANGGPITTQGSLMAERGIRLTIERQDMNDPMRDALVTCARELHRGANDCQDGKHFVTIMGDGGGIFLHGLNELLGRLGSDYVGEVVASAGFSRGEDKFMGPPTWRDNPQTARGGTVIGVLRDGDWNIAILWARANGICNNANERTYDPNCLNWIGIDDYIRAVQQYNANACETRPVVSNGRPTGAQRRICPDAVVTWTPGDVMAIEGPRPNIVSILSTAENRAQMPNAVIGIRRWNRTHREAVAGMIAAMGLGGLAVTTNEDALGVASEVSNAIYRQEGTTPSYWRTLYRGESRLNRTTGERILLGGSKANTLADMLEVFGLNPGSANAMAATYATFAQIVREEYPDQLPSFRPFDEVSDLSYLRAAGEMVQRQYGSAAQGQVERTAFNPVQQQTAPVLMRNDWRITFATAQAAFTPSALATLNQLRDQLTVSSNTFVEITGHTDNIGNPASNQVLSQQRANAVRSWLMQQGGENTFPAERIVARGRGQSAPRADNSTEAGRTANRRVEIVLRANTAPQ